MSIKISLLPFAGPLNGTEGVPVVQAGITKRTTAAAIAALGGGGGGGGGSTTLTNNLTTGATGTALDAAQGPAITALIGAREPAITAGSTAQVLRGDKSLGAIVNDLTTGGTTAVLSAQQGVAIKAITDANAANIATNTSAIAGKEPTIPSGTTAQYIRGDKTLAVFPAFGTVTATAGALTANALVVGNGGTDEKVLASLGTTTTVLHGNAAGPPTFGPVALAADVSGVLPVANGGTGTTTPGIVAGANVTVTGTWPNQTVSAGKPGGVTVTAGRDLAAGDIGNLLVCDTSAGAIALNITSGLGSPLDVIFFKRQGANALTITASTGTLNDPYSLQSVAIPNEGEGVIQCKVTGTWNRYA